VVSPASSTTKTGRHDIAESGVKHNKSINQLKINHLYKLDSVDSNNESSIYS